MCSHPLKQGSYHMPWVWEQHLNIAMLNGVPYPKAGELQLNVFGEGSFYKHPDQQLCMAKHQRNVLLSFYSCHHDLWRRPSPSGDQSSVCYQTPCSHRRRQWDNLENHQFSYVLLRCFHLWVFCFFFLLLLFVVVVLPGLRIDNFKIWEMSSLLNTGDISTGLKATKIWKAYNKLKRMVLVSPVSSLCIHRNKIFVRHSYLRR